jgi:hypothetical protein
VDHHKTRVLVNQKMSSSSGVNRSAPFGKSPGFCRKIGKVSRLRERPSAGKGASGFVSNSQRSTSAPKTVVAEAGTEDYAAGSPSQIVTADRYAQIATITEISSTGEFL